MESLLSFVEPYFEEWGYAIVFTVRLLENSAFLGAIIPGDVVLLLAGFYAQRGALEIGPVMVLAFTGAVIGDTIGYMIGRFGGRRLIDRYGDRFWLPQDRLERFDRYFAEYGMWAVALGRITPVVRTINTFAAGMSRMPFWQFFIAVVLAAGAWSVAVPILGYLFSGSLEVVRSTLGWAGGAIFLLFIFALYWSYRRMMQRLDDTVDVQAADE